MKTLIGAVFFLATSLVTAFAQNQSFVDRPYIEVTTNFDSLVTPNQIFIKIVISEQDSKGKVPVEASEQKMIAALQSLGIKTDTKLTNSDILSNFKSNLLRQKDVLKTKEYTLEVSDAKTASNVFLKLEELGIANTSITRLSHSNIDKITDACRVKAIENAKYRAILLAKPLGQNIGPAIHIVDFDRNTFGGQQTFANVLIRGNSLAGAPPMEEPQIEFQKIRLSVSINVKFLLK